VVFTGRLKILRRKAARLLVKRAGGISQANVSRTTDIVVMGEQSPNWKAEKKGQKLLDLDHERERGHPIVVITEKRFQNLIRGSNRR
jgi:BRCT domain type II-containing protein